MSGIRIRKTEELIEDAVITDDGIGYALSDEGTLFTLSEGKAATKKLCGDAILDAWALTPEFCVVVYDADSDYDENYKEIPAVNVKLVNLSTAASWRKKDPLQLRRTRDAPVLGQNIREHDPNRNTGQCSP